MSFGERPQDYPRYTDRPADQPQYGGPQYSGPQYGGTQYGAYPVQPGFPDQPAYGLLRDNSNATVALVLGVLAFVTGLLSRRSRGGRATRHSARSTPHRASTTTAGWRSAGRSAA